MKKWKRNKIHKSYRTGFVGLSLDPIAGDGASPGILGFIKTFLWFLN